MNSLSPYVLICLYFRLFARFLELQLILARACCTLKFMFKYLILLSMVVFFTACTTPVKPYAAFEELNIRQGKNGWIKLYAQNYEAVWRAALITIKYPIAINNIDTGILETDWIRAEEGFQTPAQEGNLAGIRYKISLVMVKGSYNGRAASKVTVRKVVEKRRDFFSEGENLISDGFEEANVLYRIDRELVIDEAIKKANGAKN